MKQPAVEEAREALRTLAGDVGFEGEMQEDGTLYVLGKTFGIRPMPMGYAVVYGPRCTGAERAAVIRRGDGSGLIHPEIANFIPWCDGAVRIAAWWALEYACKAERTWYEAWSPERLTPSS